MTREEAIKKIKKVIEESVIFEDELEAFDMAIEALEQEDTVPFDFELYQLGLMDIPEEMIKVLDKIRAEIDEQYDRVHPYDISCAEGLEMALGIIDKYRAESEVQE